MLLCREKNKAIAEYALQDIQKPIGVSEYQLTRALSEDLKGRLPSVEEIEKTIEAVEISATINLSVSIETKITSKNGTLKHEE